MIKLMARKAKVLVHITSFTELLVPVKQHLPEYLQAFCTRTKLSKKISVLKLMVTFSKHQHQVKAV